MTIPRRLPVCSAPTIFAFDPEVCNGCGNLISQHPQPFEPDPRELRVLTATWAVMIAFGGPHNSWGGGPDQHMASALREHMALCGINPAASDHPTMEGAWRTDDSEHNTELVMLNGRLTCQCGTYRSEMVSVADMTLGQLMWQVARIAEAENAAEAEQAAADEGVAAQVWQRPRLSAG